MEHMYVHKALGLLVTIVKHSVGITYRRAGHFFPQEQLLYSALTYGAAPSCMVKETVFSTT